MSHRIGDLLAQRAVESIVGRAEELAALLETLHEGGPLVAHVYGIGGIGKSSLLEAFARRLRTEGVTTIRLDCRAIEPTERGFLHELGAAVGGDVSTVGEAAARLNTLGDRMVLTLDTYEVFRLMDTWLRQVFVPALSDRVRVIFFGREPPVAAWLASPGWQGLFRSIALGPLSDRDSIELLVRADVREDDARRINRFAHGHPLALRLAAAAVIERHDLELEEAAVQRVVEVLTRLYLADVQDPITRQALDAAAVVRRTTLTLLQAMLPHVAPQDAYERLRSLPFVESGLDGLMLHDVVQQVIAAALKAADPTSYRSYRRAAWRQLRAEVRAAARQELWRYTADMLYLIENPIVREAYFPSGPYPLAVESAHAEDRQAIRTIVERWDGSSGAKLLDCWWSRLPEAFRVVRSRDSAVVGFYCMFDAQAADAGTLREDPVTRSWLSHLAKDPVPKGQRVLFLRRWLTLAHGEELSPEQAAMFLDVKRTYMEMRPHLRRLYQAHSKQPSYWPAFQGLGFRWLADYVAQCEGITYHTSMQDFGPLSVDGWLANLVASELGLEDSILDIDSRELVVDGRRVPLTKLELEVMLYLYQREGKVVSRMSLLEDVWGYNYEGGSNVVDAVVRLLRKKLGAQASLIETVSGVGYRLRSG
jgi:hypothetical protein